ncbi:hypothetical protein [Pseudomonas guariconensis]|uniref:hypothetical protein n=1 Tax=Pseudomonas guariconensis TaxID=1288410 RepID=UPI002D1F8017|nr:hypothetical protein [Pseudomonas guariconensis]MEB3841175.1 hypothetical protein [Pseudomonas guariconensis]MEB3874043.1 hypothetical protein [Pseudomonas guariconensis]MEB3877527.1 hypothetical protein [Pseudomonas guariconensis]MEB3893977.1 hypothetical protein [Pseudomonas guariconensis]
MKAPSKPTPSKPAPKKPAGKKGGGGINFSQAMEMANASADAFKAFADYKKESLITERALIDGERAIRLGEQQLKEAHLRDQQHLREHHERMYELETQGRQAENSHEHAMASLDSKVSKEDRILKQLEEKEITAQEAALLLYGGQE